MDTTKRNGEPDRGRDIFPDGDVVLVVGEEKERLRVHSQCLRSASKVFGAMFGPDWIEGQRLTKASPTEVPLPNDDAHAIRIICYIVHHRNDLVPEPLTADEILQIAIEVDKYDLKIALRFASLEWLKPAPDANSVAMGHLLSAAFLFDNKDMFMEYTITLILHYNGSYLDFLDDEYTGQIIPSRTFYLLEERRTKFRAELCRLLIQGKRDICRCRWDRWGKIRREKYGGLLVEYMPTKMLEVCLAEIIIKMIYVSDEDIGSKYCVGRSINSSSCSKPLPYSDTLLGKLNAMKRKAGICIDCVQSMQTAEL